jgi:4-carboxymuconolactone decarboxylase
VFGTLANHPKLFRKWLVFANYILVKSTLDPRTRELAVLRVGWRCDAPYEWGQHVVVGRAVGLSDDDIRRVAEGPDADGWTPAEVAALRATDELHDRSTITDATWAALTEHFTEEQVLDLVFLVGNYHIVSFALNACRVERDDGVDDSALPFPAPAR